MFKLTILATLFCVFSVHANIKPLKEKSIFDKIERKSEEPKQELELVISDETEVKLDGKICKLENIPKGAEVVLLEINENQITKIHFRSKK